MCSLLKVSKLVSVNVNIRRQKEVKCRSQTGVFSQDTQALLKDHNTKNDFTEIENCSLFVQGNQNGTG